MIYFGMGYGNESKTECSNCNKIVKIQGDTNIGYNYRCVCGYKEEYGKLPREFKDTKQG